MNKEELIKELNRLAELNELSNPIAASVLYTLSGLCLTDNEGLISIETERINNHFLTNLQKLNKDEN